MGVLARFRVIEKAQVEHYKKNPATDKYESAFAYRIKLTGVKTGAFGEATPSANADMLIVPHDAAAQFIVGKVYLATFDLDPDQSTT